MVEINNCNPGWATSSFPFFLTLLTSKFLNSRSSQFSCFSKFIQTFHVQIQRSIPRRVNQKKKKTKKGRELIEDSIVGLISSGLRHLSADLNSEDDQHQDFPEYD